MSPNPFVLRFDDPEKPAPPALALRNPPPSPGFVTAVRTSTAAPIWPAAGRPPRPATGTLTIGNVPDCRVNWFVGDNARRVSPILFGDTATNRPALTAPGAASKYPSTSM